MKTIGVVGGMSWTSSIEYYRRINQITQERLGGSNSARIVMWSVNFAEHLAIHETMGWDGVGAEAADIARRLEKAGADFVIMAVNTLHRVAERVEAAVDIPLLHIAAATGDEIARTGLRKVGLLGTGHTMNEDFYRGYLAEHHQLEVIVPDQAQRTEIDRIIFEELVCDRYEDPARQTCRQAIAELADRGAEGVILGCTELPRLVGQDGSGVPLFDTLEIHVKAAVDLALADG